MLSTEASLRRLPHPFLCIKIIVGDFLLGEDEQPLLVVQRRGLLLLLRAFNEELLQDEI